MGGGRAAPGCAHCVCRQDAAQHRKSAPRESTHHPRGPADSVYDGDLVCRPFRQPVEDALPALQRHTAAAEAQQADAAPRCVEKVGPRALLLRANEGGRSRAAKTTRANLVERG